jgi:hypothetical protein
VVRFGTGLDIDIHIIPSCYSKCRTLRRLIWWHFRGDHVNLLRGYGALILMHGMLLAKKRSGDRKTWLENKGNLAEV